MKLHLPTKLLSALVAAAAALVAVPASAAITGWDITGWTGYDATTQSVTVGTTTTETGASTNVVYAAIPSQTWNGGWSVVVSADASTLKGALTLMGLEMTKSNQSGLAEGATMGSDTSLTLTTWTTAEINGPVDFSSYDNVVFVMSRDGSNGSLSLSAYNSANLVRAASVLTQTTQTFGSATLSGVVFGGMGNKGKYPDTTNNHVTFADDSAVGSYSITNAGYSAGSMASAHDLVDFLYGADRKTLTWDGGASGEWSAASWSDGTASEQNFGAYDSAVLGTEGAVITLTGATLVDSLAVNANTTIDLAGNNLNAFELTVASGKELSLSGSGTVDVGSLTGGTINATGDSVAVTANTVSNSTLKGNATLVAGSITGSTVEWDTILTGTALENSTIKGTLTLTGSERVGLTGTVTLDSVVNNLTGGSNGYALVGGAATLTFTGTTDLTKTSSGETSNYTRIGLGSTGTLIIAEGASLTTSAVFNSPSTQGSNGAVIVKDGGSLTLVGDSSGYNNNSFMLSLTNAGSINSRYTIDVKNNVTNTGTLTAATLAITNTGALTSDLGGTVDVDTLNLKGGTATVSGNVTAGTAAGSANTTLNGSGTLTIDGSSTASSASNLSGSFAIVKTGSGTQSFTGNTNDYAGSLTLSGGTLNLANMGENSLVTSVSISGGATLGLYKAAIAADASTDVETTLNLTSLTVGTGGGTLNANLILGSGSTLTLGATLNMGSALTLNGNLLKGDLFDSLMNGTVTSITLFTGVDALYIGDSVDAITTDYIFTGEDMAAAFANDLDASVYQVAYAAEGGLVTMRLVPEPATATLSLLALAALCARRRRK